jgi:hypothetical protein
MSYDQAFKDFFTRRFGVMFFSPDDPGVQAAADCWNEALSIAAKQFAYDDDLEFKGDQVADKLLRMKVHNVNAE